MNKYSLLDDNEENNEMCEKLIDKAIDEFVDRIKFLHKKFPNCGLGDTMTDEDISSVVYDKIHQL